MNEIAQSAAPQKSKIYLFFFRKYLFKRNWNVLATYKISTRFLLELQLTRKFHTSFYCVVKREEGGQGTVHIGGITST